MNMPDKQYPKNEFLAAEKKRYNTPMLRFEGRIADLTRKSGSSSDNSTANRTRPSA